MLFFYILFFLGTISFCIYALITEPQRAKFDNTIAQSDPFTAIGYERMYFFPYSEDDDGNITFD
jgi:hypothetical protein